MAKITLPNNIEKVINASGKVPSRKEESNHNVARVTLYLPNALKKEIEKNRISAYKRQTINSWVVDAIILKLKNN